MKIEMSLVYKSKDNGRAAFDDGAERVSYIGMPNELWEQLGKPKKITVTVERQ